MKDYPGSITMTLNLPCMEISPTASDSLIVVQESLRSPWTFMGMDKNGNTLWLLPLEKNLVWVEQAGAIRLEGI